MNLGRFTAGTLVSLALAAPAWSAPLFSDVTSDHWASDAVRELAGRGLIQGCADGTFQGNRCLSRWEMATMVSRLLQRIEEAHTSFATRAELEELNRLVEHLRPELNALGVRLDALEKQVVNLDKRVSELERITYYGSVQTAVVAQSVRGTAINNDLLAVDWLTGRVMRHGSSVTMLGLMGVNVNVSDDFTAGAEFAAYASTAGKDDIDAYWGVMAPHSCNVWTQNASFDPLAQPSSNRPYTRMVLDNIWLNHEPSGTRFVAGSFRPRYVGNYVFSGARNPNIHGGNWLPLYGFNLTGTIAGLDSGFKYEALYTEQPDTTLYNTHSYGGSVRYDFADDRGNVALNFMNHRNERIGDGALHGPAGVALPSVPMYGGASIVPANAWLGTHSGDALPSLNMGVGPQQQFSYGIDASYTILPDWGLTIDGAFATTSYDPDTSKLLYNETATGSMYKIGVNVEPLDGLKLDMRYQHVDATYDPFISQYAADTHIPVYLPFGSFYSGYYQMHDYLELPNNRQGVKVAAQYAFNENNTNIAAYYSHLQQVKATTPEQCTTVGNIEPIFGMLYGDENVKGYVQSYGLGINHKFTNGFKLNAGYYHYDMIRSAQLAENDMGLKQNLYSLDIAYPICNKLNLRASYSDLTCQGNTGLTNTDIHQATPGIGLDYQADDNMQFRLDYRFIDFDQKAFDGADYQANQVILEMKYDF